ncbi:hypothetical protein [Pararhizobium sp.]|uniref:hypothetical protein n=1 Tax=Pararhizobium sp. TaxID=1977563 RepID=UPI003D10177B
MNFCLVETYRYWWPVTVSIPDPKEPGKFVKQRLKVEFEAEDRDEAIARMDAIAAMPPKEQADHEYDALKAIVKNWDDVMEADQKTPVPYSPENFEKAIKFNWFRTAIYRAYGESMSGDEARLGN